MNASILIVDDEEYMLDLLSLILEENFSITTASNGENALQLLASHSFDLCLLDIMMPRINGFDVIKLLKRQGNGIPIIFVSARVELEDRVEGLELGADDYITKPFEPTEVLARVKSVLRRTKKYQGQERVKYPGIQINLSAREVWVEEMEVKLTPIEYELLVTLAQKPNHAFSREQLLERIWDYSFVGDIRTVDTHIKNLRNKLREARYKDKGIQTVWGYGYKWGVR